MSKKTLVRNLETVRDIVEEGWTKRTMFKTKNKSGRWVPLPLENLQGIREAAELRQSGLPLKCCLMGAVDLTLMGVHREQLGARYLAARTELLEHLNTFLSKRSGDSGSLVAWNDRAERTQKQVLGFLDYAINQAQLIHPRK